MHLAHSLRTCVPHAQNPSSLLGRVLLMFLLLLLLLLLSMIRLQVCYEYCTELGAAFMATQWGFECWCSPDGGLDYNRHYEITGEDAVCDMPCMGDEVRIMHVGTTLVLNERATSR